MKIGRGFTNILYFNYLGEEEERKLRDGEIGVHDVDAIVQETAKVDVVGQVEVAKQIGIDHVELDGAVPTPYLSFTAEQKEQAKSAARRASVDLSFHLLYTYVGGNTCAPYEQDRQAAVKLQRQYIEFAAEIGCNYVNMHPGVVPFYHAMEKYFDLIRTSLVKTLLELGELAKSKGLVLHVENNTAFDGCFYEVEELCSVVEEVRSRGVDVYFNFDIGHWFTRADIGKAIPKNPRRPSRRSPTATSRRCT